MTRTDCLFLARNSIALTLFAAFVQVNAQTSTDTSVVDDLKAQKEVSDAKTAFYESLTAAYEAELAATKAKFGGLDKPAYEGTADISSTAAGTAEGTLLGITAVNQMAQRFADKLLKEGTSCHLVLTSSTSVPDFQMLTAFNAQHAAIEKVFAEAEGKETSAYRTLNRQLASSALAALPYIGNLLSFAKTDYKFINIVVTSTDEMLLRALAARLQTADRTLFIPALYLPGAGPSAEDFFKKIGKVDEWAIAAKRYLIFYEALKVEATKKADSDAKKAELKELELRLATWRSISEGLEAWSKKLATADDKGISIISAIIRQHSIKSSLDPGGADLLIVQLHTVAATGYSKKNLWSSLGANPFYVMGGAVASYVLVNGISGAVKSSQLLPLSGGYHSVSKLEAKVNDAKVNNPEAGAVPKGAQACTPPPATKVSLSTPASAVTVKSHESLPIPKPSQ